MTESSWRSAAPIYTNNYTVQTTKKRNNSGKSTSNHETNTRRTSWSWRVQEKDLNNDFKLCFNFNKTFRKDEWGIKTELICGLYDHYESSTSCNQNSHDLDKPKSCHYSWNNVTKEVLLTIYNSEDNTSTISPSEFSSLGINLICYVHDELFEATYRTQYKYIFNQPVVIESPTYKCLVESKNSLATSSPVVVIVSVLLVLAAVSILFFVHYRRKQKRKLARSRNTSTSETYHFMRQMTTDTFVRRREDSVESECSCMEHFPQESENCDCSDCERLAGSDTNEPVDNRIGDDSSDEDENTNDDSVTPKWLSAKPEMFYSPLLLDKGKKLGAGNFGAVFEGKLRLGNAVYVYFMLDKL